MPRTSKFPRLRKHTRAGKGQQVWTSWYYDMRPEGKPDVPLGSDYDQAIEKWRELHEHQPRIRGTIEEAFERWEAEILPGYENAGTRRTYATNLRRLRPVFGPARWHTITFAVLKDYLRKRNAKTQANRELSVLQIVWNWARGEDLTTLQWPAAGLSRSRWKNKEQAREFEVTDALFAAVHAQGDQVLRDCMDLSSATGMRLTDCRTILLPRDDVLRLKASKTGKKADFDLALSQVLPDLLERRRAVKTTCLMLLVTPTGRQVSPTMLRDRWDAAREAAAKHARAAGDEALAKDIEAMWLRDMRKMAADRADSDEAAAELLQHGDKRLTQKHYRTRATRLKPVR